MPPWLRAFAVGAVVIVAGALGWSILHHPKKPLPQEIPIPSPPVTAPPPAKPQPVSAATFVKPTPISSSHAAQAVIPSDVIANWQLPDGPEITSKFITTWVKLEPAAAGRWLASQPDSPARHAGAETLAELWARADLHAATKWALSLPDDGIVKSLVFDRLAAPWVEKDPLAASGYFAQLPAGELRRLGASALFELWSQRDANGMHAALGKIPGAIADDARASLAPAVFPRNATAAMNILCGIKEPARKIQAIHQLHDYWRRRNRSAAMAWLAQSALSEDERKQISDGQ